MNRTYILAVGLVASMLAACAVTAEDAGDPGEVTESETNLVSTTTLPATADLSIPPEGQIFFDPSWQEQVNGTLYAGGRVWLIASPDRFPKCGASGKVTASVRPDSGAVIEVAMDDRTLDWPRGALTLPLGTTSIEVWLRSETDGCTEYDSDFGKNYRFAVHAWKPTVVHFNRDWSENSEAALTPGGVLLVDYDLDRLPLCRGTYRGLAMWDVAAHVRFSGGEYMRQSVVGWVYQSGIRTGFERGLAVFPIPENATAVEVWFENSQQTPYPQPEGCPAWDSDFGKNYRFEIR